jgi:protein-L-isoaspartate(D-aspartate) O-methyltransferase
MVRRLESMGINDQKVLKVMGQIPRHRFIAEALGFQAYDEKALPIGFKQTISHPYTVARMTEVLNVKDGDKILEIGTGSGYQTAILIALGARVYSVEIIKSLTDKAKKLLTELGYHSVFKCGDGRLGWSAHAPYNAIIVTAGAPVVPGQLLSQLQTGGKMIIPIGSK